MSKTYRKLIAPVIITVLLVVYFAFYLILTVSQPLPLIGRIIFIVVPLGLMGVSVFVLIERINEIRSGEEDDLSKY